MNNKKLLISVFLISLIVFALVPAFVEAQQAKLSLFENLRTGKTFEGVGNFLKGSIFKWYTTTGNDLNPQYETQRRIVDSLLFFIIVFTALYAGLKRTAVFKDLKGAGIAFAVATSIFFINYFVVAGKFSIGGFLVKNSKFIALAFLALIIYLLLNAFFKPKNAWQKILMLAASVLAAWLIISQTIGFAFNTEFPGKDVSSELDSVQAQLDQLPPLPPDATPEQRRERAELQKKVTPLNLQQALWNMQNFKYPEAKTNMANILDIGPAYADGSKNPQFDKALELAEEKLFAHMAQNQITRIRGQLAIAAFYTGEYEQLRDKAKSLPSTDLQGRKEGFEAATTKKDKALEALKEAKSLEGELDIEIAAQNRTVERIRRFKGIS